MQKCGGAGLPRSQGWSFACVGIRQNFWRQAFCFARPARRSQNSRRCQLTTSKPSIASNRSIRSATTSLKLAVSIASRFAFVSPTATIVKAGPGRRSAWTRAPSAAYRANTGRLPTRLCPSAGLRRPSCQLPRHRQPLSAGIRPGDHLLTFNNEPVPRYGTAGWIGGFVRNNGYQPIQILVRRDGVEKMHTVTPVKACAIPIELQRIRRRMPSPADDGIVVYSSILRLARTDAQLALIIGHELAHANLGHLDKQRVNTILGWAGGAAIDAGIMLGGISTGGAFSKQFSARRRTGLQRRIRTRGRLCRRLLCGACRLRSYRSGGRLAGILIGKPRQHSHRDDTSGYAGAIRPDSESRCRNRGQTAPPRAADSRIESYSSGSRTAVNSGESHH